MKTITPQKIAQEFGIDFLNTIQNIIHERKNWQVGLHENQRLAHWGKDNIKRKERQATDREKNLSKTCV